MGVSRQSVHAWIARYEQGGLGALADRSHRPSSCPHQTLAEIEARICELRRSRSVMPALDLLAVMIVRVRPSSPLA